MKIVVLLPLVASTLLIGACSRSPVAPVSGPESTWSVFATREDPVSVSGTSSSNVYALGYGGTLFHFDGLDWTISMPFGSQLHWIKLWCASPQDVFAVARDYVGANRQLEYRVHHFDGSVASPTGIKSATRIDLWGDSENNVYAVGAGGMIQRYDGASWQPMESGTTEDICAIWGLPTGELFAALRHSVLYYDQTSWREILTTSETLEDIWASSCADVYAVGKNAAVLHYDGQAWALTRFPYGASLHHVFGTASNDVYVSGSTTSKLYRFNGVNWQSTSLPIESFDPSGLWASSAADVFAVGSGNEEGVLPSILHFDGTAWHRESIEYLLPTNRGLTAIYGREGELYVGGDYSKLLRFDGTSWRAVLGSDGNHVSDIVSGPGDWIVVATDNGCVWSFDGAGWKSHYCGNEVAYVWATSLHDVFKVAGAGIVHFDGRTWQSMESNTTQTLNDVWGRSSVDAYAVGDSGTVVHYDGQSWQRMETGTTENLRAICGDSEFAVAVGDGGTILQLKEAKWIPMDSPSVETLTGVWGASSSDIYAVGEHVVLHHDGSRWGVLSDTIGGRGVWGRSSDDVYVVEQSRILHYGPSQSGSNR